MPKRVKVAEPGGPQEMTLQLRDIVRDPAYQLRANMKEATVRSYIGVLKSGKKMPPVRVAVVEGVPVLVDGWHRTEAMTRLGWEKVEALVHKATRSEARWLAAEANLEHGLPLKPREVKAVFAAYIRAKQHRLPGNRVKSYREMAAEIGRSHNTIRNWTRQLFPALFAEIGGEAAQNTGGLGEVEVPPECHAAALRSMAEVERLFGSISDPKGRGDIVQVVRESLMRIEGSASWTIEKAETDF